ncbi:MAG: uL14 family ribosomal protein [Nanoarchaeota archaeon]|nr:uL14 family ribosomal protein [Nanoarchaeota archaeon]
MAKNKKIGGKAISARATRGLNIGAMLVASDNSGARIVRLTGVKIGKSTKKRQQYAKIGDHVKVSVRAGKPDMKGEVFDAVVIRQKKPYRRLTGERVCFEDNAVALMKDEKGNPKGTQIKGPVAREIQERWGSVAKIAQFVL